MELSKSTVLTSKSFVYGSQETMLWEGAKKFLCFNSFTRYAFTSARLFYCHGIFNLQEGELELFTITKFEMSQSFIQRIFGRGDITVHYNGGKEKFVLENIANVKIVKEHLFRAYKEDRRFYLSNEGVKWFNRLARAGMN